MTDYDKALYWWAKATKPDHFLVDKDKAFEMIYGSYFDKNGKQIKELI